MEVLITFFCTNNRVEVRLHYLHSDAKALLKSLSCGPTVQDIVHRSITRRVRPLLEALDLIREGQRWYEAASAREARGLGHRRVLARCLDSCVLHDACTLYIGCAAALFGGGSWFRAFSPCECGNNWWGFTCTPPRLTPGGKLVRDTMDAMTGFCWSCLRRRDVTIYEVACGWDCFGLPCHRLFLTQNAPQNSV